MAFGSLLTAGAQAPQNVPAMTTIPGNDNAYNPQDNAYDIPTWLLQAAGPNAVGQAQAAGSTAGFGGFGGAITQSGNTIGGKNLYASESPFQDMQGYSDKRNIYVRDPANPGAWISYDATSPAGQAALTGKYSALNGTNYNVLDANGNVIGQRAFTGLKDKDHVNDVMMAVGGAALGGMAMLGGAAGAGGAAGGVGGGAAEGIGGAGVTGFGSGADLSAFYGGLDGGATLGGGGTFTGVGMGATGVGAGGLGAAGGGVMPPNPLVGGGGGVTSAGSGGFLDSLKAGASSLLGGGSGGGGMSWSSLVSPAMQAIGGLYQNYQAGQAADAQAGAAQAGIDETRRQFDTVRQLLSPYVNAGNGALSSYQALSGALGPDAQQAAITSLKGTPQFGMLTQQGEDAILQNASATGGLRGGNTQDALAKYRTQVLSGLIDQQLGRYGSLINTGQNSAAGTGTAAMATGQNVANLLQQQGAAQAGGIVAGTNAITNALGGVGGFFSARGWTPSTIVPSSVGYGGAGISGGGGFGTGTVYGNQDYGQYF